jgi:2-methylisocitrate lyase-like PEP mutase family enzyme
MTQADKARLFASLHRPGEPVVLFNVWDAGSAKAVADAGAKAVATGSASVAAAYGYADAEALPLELALENAERVVNTVELPVTIDFEGGYAVEPEAVAANVARLAATGAIGCNYEDQVIGGDGLHPIELQAARIRAAREAAGPDFFLNARTDIFLKAPRERHDAAMVDEALARGRAYADAGASGLFVAGLIDLALLARCCARSPLPVNYIAVPGGPSAADVAATGVARISHGPFPYRRAMAALKQWAGEVHG